MKVTSTRKARVVTPRRKFDAPIVAVAIKQRTADVSITPPSLPTSTGTPPTSITSDTYAYHAEFWRRSVLFLDTLRVRANNMLAHEQAGLPPLLNFEYETILDARSFESPLNYALLRITGHGKEMAEECEVPGARPVIIIDPRAGHGPGIGGFKRDSEVGIDRKSVV